jgi:two-component system chemotaxis response regulator CheY
VEDDFTSRVLLQTFPSRVGECHIAVTGKEAVDACRAAREQGREYDLICMDILMPEMDGHGALRVIREQEAAAGVLSKAAKIVLTTGLGKIENVNAAYEGLCDGYLVKPIHAGKLLEELKTVGLVR